MKYYENLAEMYVGDDVSPDFYGWVFPKYDHVAVGTGRQIFSHVLQSSFVPPLQGSGARVQVAAMSSVFTQQQHLPGLSAFTPCGWLTFGPWMCLVLCAGTVVNKTAIKQYQQATRDRAKVKTEGGKIIR